MKTKKILLVAAVALLIGQTSVKAVDAEKITTAQNNLIEAVSKIANRAPYELVSDEVDKDKLYVTFKVSETGDLTSIKVEGENEKLARWVEIKLERQDLDADPVLAGTKCLIPISYKVL